MRKLYIDSKYVPFYMHNLGVTYTGNDVVRNLLHVQKTGMHVDNGMQRICDNFYYTERVDDMLRVTDQGKRLIEKWRFVNEF